jgi:copper resistance protein C
MRAAPRFVNIGVMGVLVLLASFRILPEMAMGHAFLDHADPKVGATLAVSPKRVRIWFDSPLKPAFSSVKVYNGDGKKVDKGDGGVNPSDAKLLGVGLPSLPPGVYRVVWEIVTRDGHRITGDYTFAVR